MEDNSSILDLALRQAMTPGFDSGAQHLTTKKLQKRLKARGVCFLKSARRKPLQAALIKSQKQPVVYEGFQKKELLAFVESREIFVRFTASKADLISELEAADASLRFDFQGLPVELRDMVYRYVCITDYTIYGETTPAIARVCRDIRHEALRIFYAMNRFAIFITDKPSHPVFRHYLNELLVRNPWLRYIHSEHLKLIHAFEFVHLDRNTSVHVDLLTGGCNQVAVKFRPYHRYFMPFTPPRAQNAQYLAVHLHHAQTIMQFPRSHPIMQLIHAQPVLYAHGHPIQYPQLLDMHAFTPVPAWSQYGTYCYTKWLRGMTITYPWFPGDYNYGPFQLDDFTGVLRNAAKQYMEQQNGQYAALATDIYSLLGGEGEISGHNEMTMMKIFALEELLLDGNNQHIVKLWNGQIR